MFIVIVIAQSLGRVLRALFGRRRVALVIIGFGVPHTHIHLVPIDREADLRFTDDRRQASADELAAAGDQIRDALAG